MHEPQMMIICPTKYTDDAFGQGKELTIIYDTLLGTNLGTFYDVLLLLVVVVVVLLVNLQPSTQPAMTFFWQK
jgi:hypothetical protein